MTFQPTADPEQQSVRQGFDFWEGSRRLSLVASIGAALLAVFVVWPDVSNLMRWEEFSSLNSSPDVFFEIQNIKKEASKQPRTESTYVAAGALCGSREGWKMDRDGVKTLYFNQGLIEHNQPRGEWHEERIEERIGKEKIHLLLNLPKEIPTCKAGESDCVVCSADLTVIDTDDGRTLYKAPSERDRRWAWIRVLTFPVAGFLLPLLAWKTLSWVALGFLSKEGAS